MATGAVLKFVSNKHEHRQLCAPSRPPGYTVSRLRRRARRGADRLHVCVRLTVGAVWWLSALSNRAGNRHSARGVAAGFVQAGLVRTVAPVRHLNGLPLAIRSKFKQGDI